MYFFCPFCVLYKWINSHVMQDFHLCFFLMWIYVYLVSIKLHLFAELCLSLFSCAFIPLTCFMEAIALQILWLMWGSALKLIHGAILLQMKFKKRLLEDAWKFLMIGYTWFPWVLFLYPCIKFIFVVCCWLFIFLLLLY